MKNWILFLVIFGFQASFSLVRAGEQMCRWKPEDQQWISPENHIWEKEAAEKANLGASRSLNPYFTVSGSVAVSDGRWNTSYILTYESSSNSIMFLAYREDPWGKSQIFIPIRLGQMTELTSVDWEYVDSFGNGATLQKTESNGKPVYRFALILGGTIYPHITGRVSYYELSGPDLGSGSYPECAGVRP